MDFYYEPLFIGSRSRALAKLLGYYRKYLSIPFGVASIFLRAVCRKENSSRLFRRNSATHQNL